MAAYHPQRNPGALPPVRNVADIDGLPWGGNAWWDIPIMNHVRKSMTDGQIPRRTRRAMLERAGYLMTGEDCRFRTFADFDDEVDCIRREG